MKIYFQYDGEPKEDSILSDRKDRPPMKLKITLPSSWLSGPCSKLLNFFVSNYNKKYDNESEGQKGLVEEEMYLRVGDIDIPLDGVVNQNVQEYNDVIILHKAAKKVTETHIEGSEMCTNYGCGKRYLPEENICDDICHYHAKPPVFHDTLKYWACCADQKAPDWETFDKIKPCCKGKHSNEKRPSTQLLPAEINNVALTEDELNSLNNKKQTEAMIIPEGAGKTGPREFEGAVHDKNAKGKVDENGYASCRNYGCQKKFLVAENDDDTACTYHSGGPVFWDTYKYWKCCPDKKCYEFDDFVKIAGCMKGKHLH
eukprot:Tbor_TRINITY_DN5641_c7_g1::TRINITY_DN5641_c7_g1_i3::g.8729::m.8729/K16729/CHORDC1, CHP1; cysteine and histidine-rich domain-containing protein 1